MNRIFIKNYLYFFWRNDSSMFYGPFKTEEVAKQAMEEFDNTGTFNLSLTHKHNVELK